MFVSIKRGVFAIVSFELVYSLVNAPVFKGNQISFFVLFREGDNRDTFLVFSGTLEYIRSIN